MFKFLDALHPCPHLATDLHYKIHTTSVTLSAFWGAPPPPTVDVMCVCPLTQWAKHDPFLPPSPMILPPPPRNDSFVHHPFLISCLLPRCSIIHPCFSRRKPLIFPPKVGNKWTRKKDWGQYLNDVYKIIGFFNPLPLVTVKITQPPFLLYAFGDPLPPSQCRRHLSIAPW